MCLTLPQTMITLAGIEKVLPRFQDLEVMLQVLARSATGERMNPYTSLWTGVTPGDGPQRFHVILLDNGRSSILAKTKERQTLKCIRCAACMNTCPVYRQTGGHAYGSVYPGPIGAILTPQLMQMHHAQSLPYASSLCGACYEVCPVKINIPEVLLELRSQVVNQERKQAQPLLRPHVPGPAHRQPALCRGLALPCGAVVRPHRPALFTGKDGWIHSLPSVGGKWTQTRDLRGLPSQTFHEWWAKRDVKQGGQMSASHPLTAAHPGQHPLRHSSALPSARRQSGGAMLPCRATMSATVSCAAKARIELMIERLREYDAEVVECTPAELPAAIAGAARRQRQAQLCRSARDCLTSGWPPASIGRSTAASPPPRSKRPRAWSPPPSAASPTREPSCSTTPRAKAAACSRCCPTGICHSARQPGCGDAARIL